MAVLRQGNVKFNDDNSNQAPESDGLMTLAHPKDHLRLPVYFCTMPFLLEKDTLREVIANAATLKPQPVSVFISEQTHQQQPDLMLSVQAYCIDNDNVIKLDSIDIVSEEQAFEPSEITMIFGSDALLQHCLEQLPTDTDCTIIYLPENIQDQLKLHSLLELKTEHSVISVVNTGPLCFSESEPQGTALIDAVDLAIAQDRELFHWIESHASQLALQQPDVLVQLIMRVCTNAAANSATLLKGDTAAVDIILETANGQLNRVDALAILILIKTHVSVLAELLPMGADARVWQMLSILGHTVYHPELATQAAEVSAKLFKQSQISLVAGIGELTEPQDVQFSQIEAAILWLKELNG